MSQEPHDQNPVLVSTLNIVQGVSTPMDLIRAQTKSQVVFSFLSIGWGILADIDIESERIRAVGSQRFAIWSVARLIGLRTYQGTLSFLRVPEHKLSEHRKRAVVHSMSTQSLNFLSPLPSSKSFHSDSIDLETEAPRTDCTISRHDSFHSVGSVKSSFHSTGAGSSYQSLHEVGPVTMYGPTSVLPPLHQSLPSTWEVVEGNTYRDVMPISVETIDLCSRCTVSLDLSGGQCSAFGVANVTGRRHYTTCPKSPRAPEYLLNGFMWSFEILHGIYYILN
ncbi:hypothetical protein WDU94_006131 [Cyamophila willieti]